MNHFYAHLRRLALKTLKNIQKKPDSNFRRHPKKLSPKICKTGIKCISKTQIQQTIIRTRKP